MKPVFQVRGGVRGQNGDCLQACIATVLGLDLNQVPNFNQGLGNGKLLPALVRGDMEEWFVRRGMAYVEYGFKLTLADVLDNMSVDLNGAPYLLTACTDNGHVHTVVCRDSAIIHDPGTEPGHHTIMQPTPDGYFRVGVFLLNPSHENDRLFTRCVGPGTVRKP